MLSSVLKRGPKESDEVPSKKFKEDSSVPVKMYSMHSRPSSRASSTKSSKKNSDNSEDIDEDNLLEDDDIPDLDGDDLGDHLLSDDLLMAEESSSSKPRGSKRISPPPIIRPKSTSDESEGGNMWSKDYADNEDIVEDEDDDYLGQKEQVPFTLNEAGGNTYEAGYMSSVGSQAPQQQ